MASARGENTSADMAVVELFNLYADEIYRFARYSMPPSLDAHDLVQEVFFKAFRSWDGFRGEANPRTWLYGIARNTIIDWMRKQKTEQDYHIHTRVTLEDVSVPLETLIELEDALQRLRPNYRQVFILRCVEDLSVDQTCEILAWSPAKVKTTLHRAIQHLRAFLSDEALNLSVENVAASSNHGGHSGERGWQ